MLGGLTQAGWEVTGEPAAADLLLAEIAEDAGAIDVDAAVAALDAVYPCP